MGGIELGAPGYKYICFQPCPGGGLTAESARYRSLYGEIASSSQMRDGRFALTINVPVNTTAPVFLPGGEVSQVVDGGQVIEASRDALR